MKEIDPPTPRPGLTLFPEFSADLPVWHGRDNDDFGNVDAQELLALGVSRPLIERLRAWQEGWDHDPFGRVRPPREFRLGGPLSVRLAQQLQAQLPGYRIFLADSDPRPVEEWDG